MFMNQGDIEAAYSNHHDCPNVRKGVALLHSLMQAVNEQSDGWAYWSPPSKAAEKLWELLKTTGNLLYGNTHGTITADQLKQAITPIRRMVTAQKKKQAKYGNTFEFDVDQAICHYE